MNNFSSQQSYPHQPYLQQSVDTDKNSIVEILKDNWLIVIFVILAIWYFFIYNKPSKDNDKEKNKSE